MEDDIDDVFGGSKASGYIRLMLAKKKGMKVKDYAPEKKAREKKSKKYQVCKQDKFSANVLERFANKKLKENTSYPTEPEEWLYQRGPNFYRRGPDRKPEHIGNVIMPNEYHPDECKKDSTLEKKEQREAEKKAKKQEKEASKPTPEQKKAMKKEYDAQRYQKIKEAKAKVEGKGKSKSKSKACCKECKDDKVCMSKKTYLSEHDRLIKMLADTSKKTGKEAKEQSAEVKKRKLKGGVLSEEKKKQLADERKAYVKDMKENPEKYKNKSFDPSEGGTKEPCSYRPALEKGGLTFKHRISAGYQTPEDCQRIQQAQIDESNRRLEENESGVNKFFRKVVGGLTKVADFATNLPFVPTVAKEAYKAFAPPGSEFYSGGRIVKLKVMKGAGMKPEEKTFFITAEQTYEDNPPKQVGDFLLIGNSPTIDAWLNYKTNTIMIAVRGTKDFRDVKADISLPFNNLINTQRYKTDKMIVGRLAKTFSPSVYDYYLTGHSLGGAIVAQLKRDFPFLKDAVLYNSAFQPKDLIQQSSDTIKRNYTSDDPLYQAGGKLFIGANVLPMSSSNVDSVLGKVIKGYKGHKISKFRELYAM